MPEQGGGVAEQDAGELLLGEAHLVQRLLVVGQLPHEGDDGRDVVGPDGPHCHERASLNRAGSSRASGETMGSSRGASR